MMLCSNCKHLISRKIGCVSYNHKCRITGKGILTHYKTVNKSCPLKINRREV